MTSLVAEEKMEYLLGLQHAPAGFIDLSSGSFCVLIVTCLHMQLLSGVLR